MSNRYLVTIGLEVHCQVRTKTKMFCRCRTSFGDDPNSHICPVCLGLPGALPVLNEYAIEKTVLAGLMLGCTTPPVSKWDRKNYFYPDMPKNYQISQFDLPLCLGGGVPLYDHCYPNDARKDIVRPGKTIAVTRIHLEEDVAKSTHLSTASLIDFNRAGTPLMEIVSEPDIESPEEAYAYLKSLQQILRQGGISEADMEKGQLRCDVNVSLRLRPEDPLGAKIELKNLNSITAVRRSLHYEIQRQREELDAGIEQIQSTRRWSDELGETQLMRTKEDAHDYRYFPDPDLLPIRTAAIVERMKPLVPELPHEKAARYENKLGLTTYDASVLSSDQSLAAFFDKALASRDGDCGKNEAKKLANFVINTVLGALNDRSTPIADCPAPAASVAALVAMVEAGTLANNQAREVFAALLDGDNPGEAPDAVAKRLGFEPADSSQIEAIVDGVIAANPDKAAAVKEGNIKLANWFTGQVMKATKGKANPKQVTAMVVERLS
jgi:aspartyl-tRNA(Asn)/glutamyl-tRNA(Gln) amidotransferase subunit B